MDSILLLVAIVILLCVACKGLSRTLGVPVLVAFIGLGMLFGSDGMFHIWFENYSFAETVCSIALIFIMFSGGFGTRWKEARPVVWQAALLSSVGVVLTAAVTGVFCHVAFGLPWLQSLLLGSVIGSTDAASVFSILRSKRLSLKWNTASLLEVESGSNDPCSYMLVMLLAAWIGEGGMGVKLVWMLVAQIIFGGGLGIAMAYGFRWLLRKIPSFSDGFDTICVLAMALAAYALPACLGGNGYLSVYLVGIVLGNAGLPHQQELVHFFDGLTGLMQIVIFFLLGLLSFPSRIGPIIPQAFLLALFLSAVARPVAVWLLLTPFHAPTGQKGLVSWAGLRGASSIVFAIMAMRLVELPFDLFHMVFCVVLFSILLQGTLLPFAARKLDMIDAGGDVMKTFSDYMESMPVQFFQARLDSGHEWCTRAVKQITFPPQTMLACIRRSGELIIPNGDTVLTEQDDLILCGKSPTVNNGQLSEQTLEAGHAWIGRPVQKLPLPSGQLILMIVRDGDILIPDGSTRLHEQDTLILHRLP